MRLKHVLAAFLLLVPLAACAPEGGQRLVVTAQDFAFGGVGSTIKGGVIDLTFNNAGEATHEFALINRGNATVEDFKKEFPAVLEGGPFPKFMTSGIIPGEIEPGGTLRSKITVPAGNYLLVCALTDEPGGTGDDQPQGKPHYDLGMLQEITVEGDEEPADLDAVGGTFVADDYTFQVPDDLRAGERTFVFRNDQDQWHHMALNKYEDGVSAADAEKAFGTLLTLPQDARPPADLPMGEEAGTTGIMGPRRAQTVQLDLEPGTYVAACFIQDVTGGPPHAMAHKMYKGFTVDG